MYRHLLNYHHSIFSYIFRGNYSFLNLEIVAIRGSNFQSQAFNCFRFIYQNFFVSTNYLFSNFFDYRKKIQLNFQSHFALEYYQLSLDLFCSIHFGFLGFLAMNSLTFLSQTTGHLNGPNYSPNSNLSY